MRPKVLHVGGTLYWVIRTRNPDTQILKDADSTPTVAVRKNGASVGDSVTVTKRSATTGIYDCSYNPAGEVEGDEFTIEESATVTGTTTGSATYTNSWEVTVIAVERGTDGANTTTPPTASTNATAVRSELGLTGSLDSAFDAIPTAAENADATLDEMLVDHTSTGSFGAAIGAVKAKTDNLPTDPADASDIAAAFVTVNSKLDAIDDYVDSEVAAIKAVTDKLDGMLVLDGLVYQYTANALELGASSGGTVYVYPMSMEQEPRNTHATITVYTEETGSQYFFAYDSAGTALSLTGKTLEFRVADTKSKQRLYTAKTSDGTLTISLGNKVTFTKSTKFTRFANTDVTYSLRDMDAGGEVLLDGQIELMWAP